MDNVAVEAAGLMEQAAALWRAGHLVKEIAVKLDITEKRVNWWASDNRELFPSRKKKEGQKNASEILKSLATKNAIKPKFPEKAPGFPGVTIRERDACGCEFPLWGHHETFDFDTSLYCGAPRVEGKSYCGFHCDVVTGKGSAQERAAAADLLKASKAGA